MLEKEFRAEIKAGKIRNAYFFCGNEEYLKRVARRTLKNAVIEDEGFESFNYSLLSAAVSPPSELEEPLSMLPFMSERRLVEYIDVDTSVFSGQKSEELARIIGRDDLFESSVLCIISAPGEFSFVTKNAEQKFIKEFGEKFGTNLTKVDFATPAPAELAKWVVRHLEHNGVSCTADVARMIIARGGKNMDALALETEKLACYVLAKGGNTVTVDDLNAVSSADPELGAFALSNAILSGKTVDVLEVLKAAKRDKEKPTAFLAGITASFAELLTVRELASAGLSDSDIRARTGMSEYKIKLSRSAALSVNASVLEKSLSLCLETDGMLKSGSAGFEPVERLLCELAVLRRGGRV